jgi:hypothetical protein
LKISQLSVIGNYGNDGLMFIICLLLPIITRSQIVFLEDKYDDSFDKLDFLFLNVEDFSYFNHSNNLKKVKNVVLFFRHSNKNLIEEQKKFINDCKFNLDTKVYMYGEDLSIIDFQVKSKI